MDFFYEWKRLLLYMKFFFLEEIFDSDWDDYFEGFTHANIDGDIIQGDDEDLDWAYSCIENNVLDGYYHP